MKSKTLIEKQLKRKTNPESVETIRLCKKNNLIEIAGLLSMPTRKRISLNLGDINKEKEQVVIIPGKVLGTGDIKEKKKIIALSFSSSALEKLKKSKCEVSTIKGELEKGNKIEGKILK